MKGLFECSIHTRECNFYSKLCSSLDFQVLKTCNYVWHCLEDGERGALFVSFLNDFAAPPLLTGLSTSQIKHLVQQLAELHAKTFHNAASSESQAPQWHLGDDEHCPTAKDVFGSMLYSVIDERLSFLSDEKRTALRAWAEQIKSGEFVDRQCQEALKRFRRADIDYREHPRPVYSVVHGDMWLGNAMVSKSNENTMAIVDWQFCAKYDCFIVILLLYCYIIVVLLYLLLINVT